MMENFNEEDQQDLSLGDEAPVKKNIGLRILAIMFVLMVYFLIFLKILFIS